MIKAKLINLKKLLILFFIGTILLFINPLISYAYTYPGVPMSSIYAVSTTENETTEIQSVFINSCPLYQAGYMNMETKYKSALDLFKGRSINWVQFSKKYPVTVTVKVIDIAKVPVPGNAVHVWPSRFGIYPSISGNTITFTLNAPGQYSVEIGENGYKNGLMIFANPVETDIPSESDSKILMLNQATSSINSIPSSYSSVYFQPGVHNIGIFNVPSNIKNIYFAEGSWVYGALKMDGNPNVRIYGRGTLSSAKLDYRAAHGVEAINESDGINLEGITVADLKYYGVRLIGKDNIVKWIKVIGGWTYNCDGITGYEGSTVSNCFIWANDDAIKLYRKNIHWNDIVVWQLNNGGIIQMAWGNSTAQNVVVSRIDVLRAEWNKPAFNRGLINCVGNHYQNPNAYSLLSNWLIEDVTTETEIPVIFKISPNPLTPTHIHGLRLKNWNVKMKMNTSYTNEIIGNDPTTFFDGFVFDNFTFNGTLLTQSNWQNITAIDYSNLVTPTVLPDPSQLTNVKIDAVKVIPSPVKNFMKIQGVGDKDSYKIFSSTGACVLKGLGGEVNVSALNSGLYFVAIDTKKSTTFLKE